MRLGFVVNKPADAEMAESYLLLSHPNGADIHLRKVGPDEEGWLVPNKNPFGIYIYTDDVEELGVEFRDEIIGVAKKPEVKQWGMLEFSINGPDGCLVRVGRPAKDFK
jgi:hypothetical protein